MEKSLNYKDLNKEFDMENNLRQIDSEELKEIQLQILNVVANFCEQNNINYWLDFGTLIGCVRHKGYIPWDDDIDLGMLRKDYDEFIKLFNQSNERYKFMSYETDKNFCYPYGKVLDTETILYEPDESGNKLSVNIDIFPYDNVPNVIEAKRLYKKRNKYNIAQVARIHKGKVKGNLVRRFMANCLKLTVRIFPRDYFVKRIIKNAKTYVKNKTDYVGDFSGSLTDFICEKSVLSSFIYSVFEGREYRIPQHYDKLLRMVYGDYMEFPPEGKRVSHHKFKAYIKV